MIKLMQILKSTNMKSWSKAALVVYLLFLLWLVLFKSSVDVFSVILNYQTRGLNLIPFTDASRGNLSEMVSNFVIFVPLGLLLSANFKRTNIWLRLVYILAFSVAVEVIQFVLAIGVTDITDVIMNSLGGLLGLMLYRFSSKHINDKKLDQFIIITGTILLILFMYLRFLVFKVRY